jgi:biotin carboxylase
MAITGKFPLAPPFRETGNFWPPAIDHGEAERIGSLATRALAALGVRSGITHTEIKLTPDGPRIIEVNGRLGGGIAELAQWAGGCDLITVAGRLALGETCHIPSFSPPGVYFQYHHASPQEACSINWIDGHRAAGVLEGVYRYSRVRLPAEVSAVSSTWFDTLLGKADTHTQMADILKKAGEALEFGFGFANGIRVFSGAELQGRAHL